MASAKPVLKSKIRAKRFVIEKSCSFSCKLKNGDVLMDENAIMKDVSMSGFSVISKKNIFDNEIDSICASFRDNKLIVIPLSGKVMRKQKNEDGTYLYGCSFGGYNASIKRFINHIIVSGKTKVPSKNYISQISRKKIVLHH